MREGQYGEQGLKLSKKVSMYSIRYAKGSPTPCQQITQWGEGEGGLVKN